MQQNDQKYSAFSIPEDQPASRWLVTCDHASNLVPDFVAGGSLGLPDEDMQRHIAFDPGAGEVTTRLARKLGGSAILSRFSRLVIDPNRGLDDPTLLMRLYDGSVIPANHKITDAARAARLARCYHPYHEALGHLAGRRDDTILVAVHSFTPRLRSGMPRPWQIGILFAHDKRLAIPLIRALTEDVILQNEVEAETGSPLVVGVNEPYDGHLPGDAVDRHALQHGRLNALIELRNDLISDAEGQERWATRCAKALQTALAAYEKETAHG